MRLKRGIGYGLVVSVLLVASSGGAEASSITEAFLFPDVPSFPNDPNAIPSGQNYFIGTDPALFCNLQNLTCQGTYATVLFDLTNTSGANPSNQSEYFGETLDPFTLDSLAQLGTFDTHAPDTDASGYVPGSGLVSATLTLALRGVDGDDDDVQVTAFAADGGGVLFQQTFPGVLPSTSIVIPFNAAMLSSLASDGRFGITFTSFGSNLSDLPTHDFNVESAQLTAESLDAAPVPEPSTLVLFGIGLAGAARRLRNRRRTS